MTKKSVKTEKYGFKFTESCMGELRTDKLPEIALLRNKWKSKWSRYEENLLLHCKRAIILK